MGFRCDLPILISNLLSDRTFRVHIVTTQSTSRVLPKDAPQSSAFSVSCFALLINGNLSVLSQNIFGYIYVNDLVINGSASYLSLAEHKIETAINNVTF